MQNTTNENLGDIEDFAINAADGHVTYVIISFGGIAVLP
ncbi:MAG: PRC-barrel domain-containing protein [Planctomycetes bacterium]|nr:PRC-barrel domain-containing protein [Planctomycetota bacterium]